VGERGSPDSAPLLDALAGKKTARVPVSPSPLGEKVPDRADEGALRGFLFIGEKVGKA